MSLSSLKIRWKFVLSACFIMTASVILISIVIVWSMTTNAKKEIEGFRQNEIEKIEKTLLNYVDIAYVVIDSNYKEAQNTDYLTKRYGKELESIIDVADSMIKNSLSLASKGTISMDQAKQQAIDDLKKLSYDSGKGYVWINDMGRPYPTMIMHPKLPELDGKVLDNTKFNCALGKNENLFKAFVDVCQQKGEGFVDYLWPKPTGQGLTSDQPKLSYVRYINEFNWVIGTGIYVDDAVNDSIDKSIQDIYKMRYDNGVGYFWINDTGKPYPKMIMHPTSPGLNGKILNDSKYNCALDKNENLFKAFVDVCEKSGKGFVNYLWPKPTKDGLTKEQPKLSYVRLYEPLNWIIGTGVYIDDITAAIDKKKADINNQIGNIILKIIIAAVFILFAGSVIIFLFANTITHQLNKVVELAHKISQGDLTTVIEVHTNDEVGTVISSLNKAVEKIRSIIIELTETSGKLNQSSQMMNDTSKGLDVQAIEMNNQSHDASSATEMTSASIRSIAAAAEQMSAQLSTVATSSNQVSNNLQNIDSAASNVSNSVHAVATAIEEMYATLNEVAKNSTRGASVTNEASTKADNTSDIVNRLSEAAKEIGAIVDLIKGIASQTNLLALNATIEAAGAGDAGKGFAVVANEVKELARQTASATEDIRSKIEGMQSNTASAVHAISEIVRIITEINSIMSTIASAVEEQTVTTNEISKNISSTASAADLSSKSVQEVVTVEREVTRNIQEVSQAALSIAHDASVASNKTDKATQSVLGLNTSIKTTTEGASMIKKQSVSLSEFSRQLQDIILQFKV
ncbi:MAG: methyl-accepting chemotaxis protein [Desulfobacterales bacterium]|nr:methyl-accepting chemotaxis protein [Desulfobacterales bacterium]